MRMVTHVGPEDRSLIARSDGVTARLIRFAPDFLLVNQQDPERLHFLEYKVTQTPVKTWPLLEFLIEKAGAELSFTDVAQMQAAAYDNYSTLAAAGARVAVAVWCPFHPCPLLCERAQRIVEFYRGKVTGANAQGSGTDYINYDASTLRTLAAFLVDEHGVMSDVAERICAAATERLRECLPSL
jgi:hypothetical protein